MKTIYESENRRRKASRSPTRGRSIFRLDKSYNKKELVVVKRVAITFSQQEEARWRSEMEYIRKCSKAMNCFPYTFGYSGARESESGTHIEIVRPSLPGNIYRVKSSGLFTLSEVVDATCRCMLKALQHLAANGIAHRDVRPGNIFYAEDRNGDLTLKLANFGLRVETADHPALGLRLDPYRAPEARDRETRSHASDMWSLFATLAELADLYRPGENRTYHGAWSELYAIATARPARGALDLRGMKEAIIWESDRRATASQMLAKFYESPGTNSAVSSNFTSWDAWVAQVGGEAVARGLYNGTTQSRSISVIRDPEVKVEGGKPDMQKDDIKPTDTKALIKLPSGWLDIESRDDAAGEIGSDMRKAMRSEIKRVIEDEMRQCDSPELRKALELELYELLTSPGQDADAEDDDKTKRKLRKAREARDKLEFQLKELKIVLASRDERIDGLVRDMKAFQDRQEAGAQQETPKQEDGELNASLLTDTQAVSEKRLREAIRNKEACEETLKELLEERVASHAQVKEATDAKHAAEVKIEVALQEQKTSQAREKRAVEAQSAIKAELQETLASRDELRGQLEQLEGALKSRDAMLAHLQANSDVPDRSAADAHTIEEISVQLREALMNREASEYQMKEAIEARTALKAQLREAVESRDQLKSQLQLLEEERDHRDNAAFYGQSKDKSKNDSGSVVMPSIEDHIDAQIKAAMDEKESVEAELKQVAMDRLATEAKLKDAVGARRSAEEQIRRASVVREDVEAALKRIRRERDELREQVRKANQNKSGDAPGADGEEEAPRIKYSMDPVVEKRHRHFLGLSDEGLIERRRNDLADKDGDGPTDHKRRKIITEFGNPSSDFMERHSYLASGPSSADRRIKILC
ncbi:hypothetical protein BJ166DRAFT_612835 [Pestalotiopsis sp. NC0098]|nr:hypothetical protein BJ166DRAFT_612835 [Pestalotiopsis sp. NC0098]